MLSCKSGAECYHCINIMPLVSIQKNDFETLDVADFDDGGFGAVRIDSIADAEWGGHYHNGRGEGNIFQDSVQQHQYNVNGGSGGTTAHPLGEGYQQYTTMGAQKMLDDDMSVMTLDTVIQDSSGFGIATALMTQESVGNGYRTSTNRNSFIETSLGVDQGLPMLEFVPEPGCGGDTPNDNQGGGGNGPKEKNPSHTMDSGEGDNSGTEDYTTFLKMKTASLNFQITQAKSQINALSLDNQQLSDEQYKIRIELKAARAETDSLRVDIENAGRKKNKDRMRVRMRVPSGGGKGSGSAATAVLSAATRTSTASVGEDSIGSTIARCQLRASVPSPLFPFFRDVM